MPQRAATRKRTELSGAGNLRCLLKSFVGVIGLLVFFAAPVQSQETPPKTFPPVLDSALQPDAFFFVDQFGNKVMQPGLSFEKIDQLLKAESGFAQQVTPYSFESIQVTGNVRDSEAVLVVSAKIKVTVSPGNNGNQGQVISIPLRMKNFHLRGPADVTGVEESGMRWLSTGGSVLWVKSEVSRTVEVVMRVVSRIDEENGSRLSFDLPLAPTNIALDINAEDQSANVVGRGDEIVRVDTSADGLTKVAVECTGGEFTVTWQPRDNSGTIEQLLEVDGLHSITWDEPQTPPTVNVELDVQNRRGNLTPFEIVLPTGSELIDSLSSSTALQIVQREGAAGRLQVIPNVNEPTNRIKVSLAYRLPGDDYRQENPLRFQPLDVPGAISHSGEIDIRIDRNYRLRWLPSQSIRAASRKPLVEPTEQRIYLFQFDRVPFELPIWLGAKQQRLRVEPEYTVRVGRASLTIEATIVTSGAISEGVPLFVDTSGWQVSAVIDQESGRRIEDAASSSGDGIELELAELTPGSNAALSARWTGTRSVAEQSDTVRFQLPEVRSVDERIFAISPATVNIVAEEGLTVVTDLQSTQGLLPLPNEIVGATKLQRFRMAQGEQQHEYVGYLKEKPVEAAISAAVRMKIVDDWLYVVQQWDVTPRSGLRGQLPIDGIRKFIVQQEGRSTPINVSWEAAVAGEAALVRLGEGGTAVIFSDQLQNDPCQVILSTKIPLQLTVGDPKPAAETLATELTVECAFPRPALRGTPLVGDAPLTFEESREYDIEFQGNRVPGTIANAYASDTGTLRIKPHSLEATSQLIIDRALIRSEIGRSRRYDRVLLRVTGESNRLEIPFHAEIVARGIRDLSTRVTVDGVETNRFSILSNSIIIELPPGSSDKLVDVRIWHPREGSVGGGILTPVVLLPVSIGKVYWDVVMPTDRHLLWSSSGTSELMLWRYNQLFVQRIPTRSYAELLEWIGGPPPPESQGGNRYLLVSTDPTGLRFFEAARPIIWMVVASVAMAISTILYYFRRLRHPLLVIFLGLISGGLTWLAPDLAVIVGQLLLFSLLLVTLMVGVQALLSRRPRATVLGGLPEGSSLRNESARRLPISPVEPTSTRLHDAITGSGSAGGPA